MVNKTKLVGALALAAAAVGLSVSVARTQGTPIVAVDGSSTVFPITERIAEDFQTEQRGQIRVTVGVSGTGGGFKKFCNGETDISGASRPIKSSEIEACAAKGIEYIELPVAYDALSVVVHPENPMDSITVEQLQQIWKVGGARRWRQVYSNWPTQGVPISVSDAPFVLFAPGADSGTFDYFNEAILQKANPKLEHRTDYTPSEDDNVLVTGVSGSRGGMGYFGLAYYEANKGRLKALAIDSNAGGPVAPTAANVQNKTYPLSRPIFIYVSVASLEEKPHVANFVEYYLDNVPTAAPGVGYVALDAAAYSGVAARLSAGQPVADGGASILGN